jgi:hypothetical protein
MWSTYLIAIGNDGMLGLAKGADPAGAVDDYYDALDMYCSPSDEISERFAVATLRLPDGIVEAVNDLIDEYGENALPLVEDLVIASGAAVVWHVVDVVMEAGDRTTSSRG